MTIRLKVKNIYGKELIYPVCDKSHLFTNLTNKKTLDSNDVNLIRQLGYTVEYIDRDDPKIVHILYPESELPTLI